VLSLRSTLKNILKITYCIYHTSTCFAIFDLIKFMCFGSALSYPHKEFLNPRPPRTKYNPLPPRSKFNPPRTRPANAIVPVPNFH